MATISNVSLSIAHDRNKKTAKVDVKCDVKFNTLELCQMKTCQGRWFKLKCQLWDSDAGELFRGEDDLLFTDSTVHFFPDTNPSLLETRTFSMILGEGVLNDEWGVDEIYALLRLYNINSGTVTSKKSSTQNLNF